VLARGRTQMKPEVTNVLNLWERNDIAGLLAAT
jgi:hypothetical protein